MGGLLALRSCRFRGAHPAPLSCCVKNDPDAPTQAWAAHICQQPKHGSLTHVAQGSLGRTSLPCAHRDQLVWHKCWPCAKLWAAPD